MSIQTVFKRYELKYMLTEQQKEKVLQAMEWIQGTRQCPKECQIAREINYFLEYYDALYPAVFLSCEREAFACICEDHKYGQPVSAYLSCNPSRHRKGKRND